MDGHVQQAAPVVIAKKAFRSGALCEFEARTLNRIHQLCSREVKIALRVDQAGRSSVIVGKLHKRAALQCMAMFKSFPAPAGFKMCSFFSPCPVNFQCL